MNLSGARALVTGGSEGIGYAIAKALIAKGARVAVLAEAPELGILGQVEPVQGVGDPLPGQQSRS